MRRDLRRQMFSQPVAADDDSPSRLPAGTQQQRHHLPQKEVASQLQQRHKPQQTEQDFARKNLVETRRPAEEEQQRGTREPVEKYFADDVADPELNEAAARKGEREEKDAEYEIMIVGIIAGPVHQQDESGDLRERVNQ
ncbi:MAG: hypothetical protein AW07_04569 [Candidatus Accumulibacter sp. SK-11]|nr:MAG: hypothetical protein AW07_04569 [Candidatus Accumulibacter sp. SK-11]